MGIAWIQFLAAPLLVLLVLAMVRAAIQTYNKRMVERHDAASLADFFFDQEVNPRTHVPAKKGWTSVVDATLDDLKTGQAEQKQLLQDVHATVKDLGGHIIANQEQ